MTKDVTTTGRTLRIATGSSRKAARWRNVEMAWSEIVGRCWNPVTTAETMAEYDAMGKERRSDAKDVGGFVGGYLQDGVRRRTSAVLREVICLDYDEAPDPDALWRQILEVMDGHAVLMHSTHSSRPGKPRLRVLIPLNQAVAPDYYMAAARMTASRIGMEGIDPTTFDPWRLMYWPSVSADGADSYIFQVAGKDNFVTAAELCEAYTDPMDSSEWPLAPGEGEAPLTRRAAMATGDTRHMAAGNSTVADPLEKRGIVGAVCRCYDIPTAIATFLPHVYGEGKHGRYTYLPGSSTNGVIVYDGRWIYSNHASDPAQGQLCNVFDMLRIHLYGHLDSRCKDSTAPEKTPSYKALSEEMMKDGRVRVELAESLIADFDEEEESAQSDQSDRSDQSDKSDKSDSSDDWREKLDTDKNGYRPTAPNIRKILRYDPKLKGRMRLNVFAARKEVHGRLPWGREDKAETVRQWTDTDAANLRNYIEARYGISAPMKVKDALEITCDAEGYHPVREYFRSLTWDGVPRLDRMIIDGVGAPDTELNRAMTRIHFVAAVARVMSDVRVKYDQCLMLAGAEGTGKSSIFAIMGGEWFSDSLQTVEGRDAMAHLRGKLIIEFAELQAFSRSDVAAIKGFMSKESDSYRRAYGENEVEEVRQCIFCATTNEELPLRGTNGNRRFFLINIDPRYNKLGHPLTWLPPLRDQIWAEAVHIWTASRPPLYLPPNLQEELKKVQEARNYDLDDPVFDQIRTYLDRALPYEWPRMGRADRMRFIRGESDAWSVSDRAHETVCIQEILMEGLDKERASGAEQAAAKQKIKTYLRVHADEWQPMPSSIRIPQYGKARAWKRVKPLPPESLIKRDNESSDSDDFDDL